MLLRCARSEEKSESKNRKKEVQWLIAVFVILIVLCVVIIFHWRFFCFRYIALCMYKLKTRFLLRIYYKGFITNFLHSPSVLFIVSTRLSWISTVFLANFKVAAVIDEWVSVATLAIAWRNHFWPSETYLWQFLE